MSRPYKSLVAGEKKEGSYPIALVHIPFPTFTCTMALSRSIDADFGEGIRKSEKVFFDQVFSAEDGESDLGGLLAPAG